jgi:16S rRNA (cytidine1402-2'-O)-methyltransferase
LLQSIGAGARCIALHAHNEAQAALEIIARVRQGEAVAVITDAGTPGISDPWCEARRGGP